MKEKDIKSLEHTTWRCQYHIVFAPKFRRMAIYGELKKDIGWILRKLCDEKGVEIIQAEACPYHVHMLVSIPPKNSVSSFMGFLKGKSSLMIFDRHLRIKEMLLKAPEKSQIIINHCNLPKMPANVKFH